MSIQHITELFILDGQDFVTEVYRNLLDREPDEHGLAYYLGRMARGASKEAVIVQIAKSKECKPYNDISGLKQLISDERLANHWLLKYFILGQKRNRILNEIKLEFGASAQAIAEQLVVSLSEREKSPAISSSQPVGTVMFVPMPMAANGCVPKVLHRVYFENYPPFHDPFLHYLETWKRELPQYQIIKWGPQNVDITTNEWMRRSAAAHDPVFLSEFVRWDVLKRYGGIYLDADCEILKGSKFNSLVEELDNATDYDAFVGVEEFNNGHPTAQTIATKKGSALVEFMHSLYSGPLSGPLWHWRSERGLIGPQLISLYFREHGLTETKGFPVRLTEPVIIGRVKIYPQEYFSPKFTTTGTKLAVNENTCVYHLFANLNVKDVDPEAEKHRREPMLFNDYCDYLARLNMPVRNVLPNPSSGLRKLHRVYFGFDGKPDPYRRYLDTWVSQMPGYEICHWNASNLPLENCQFSRMMHEFKDHAFLTDYFRWWILREYGGIYLDADVEITNGALLDQLVTELEVTKEFHAIIGIDSKADGWFTAHSMACKKGSPLAEFMCEVYEGMGHLSLWRRKIFYFMAPQMTSLYFASNGWNVDGMGSMPELEKPLVIAGVKVYPQQYFSPMRPIVNNNIAAFEVDSLTIDTCICHHFSCSWHTEESPYRKLSGETSMKLLREIVNLKK